LELSDHIGTHESSIGHMRGHVAHIVRGGMPCMRTLGYGPLWKREHWTNNLLESTPSWRRGVEPKEDHAWRAFHLGGWINPSLTHVHPCIVERSMWGCLVGYLYGLVWTYVLVLCYPPSPTLYIKGGESSCIHYHHCTLFFVLSWRSLVGSKMLGFMRKP
jgi:hypothetical protein